MSVTVVPPPGIKFVPLISTSVPGGAPVGLKEVMVGGCWIINAAVLVAEPQNVEIVIGPVVAPTGTNTNICELLNG